MAQGKLKVKSKLPANAKSKAKNKQNKGSAVSKRKNCPIAPKKQKFEEVKKLQKIISKNVNRSAEEEIRGRARGGQKSLSKAQQAVAAHHLQIAQKKNA